MNDADMRALMVAARDRRVLRLGRMLACQPAVDAQDLDTPRSA